MNKKEMINPLPFDAEQLFETMNKLSLTESTQKKEASAAMLAEAFYPLTEGVPQTLTDENEQALAGRFLWEDGARSVGLDNLTKKQGVIFDTLDSISRTSPDIAKKLRYWQESIQWNANEKLHADLSQETIVLYIPKHVVVAKELLLDVVLSHPGHASFLRVWTVLEAGAQAVFTMNLRSRTAGGATKAEKIFFGGCLQVMAGDGAHLTLNEVQDFNANTLISGTKHVIAGAVANVQWNMCELGGEKTGIDVDLSMAGEGGNVTAYGFYFPTVQQQFKLITRQEHLAPRTSSLLHYKGAIKDDASAHWEGMIYVDPDAKQTDGYQKNENLMLSSHARVFSKPGLEIVTDDVKCSHGTTISEIDPDQIFYLVSRGLSESDAKLLILQGFFDTILNNITYEPIREKLKEKIYLKMEQ